MLRLYKLPLALQVLLLFVFPTFAEIVSNNDHFRAIVLQVPKRPQPPQCCLGSQSQLDTAENEALVSFEEWKAKQSRLQAQADTKQAEPEANSSGATNTGTAVNEGNGQDTSAVVDRSQPISHTFEELAPLHPSETVLPHYQVPITDRFNYANFDCSARVHTSHRSAKSSPSILSSKKDRYMLSPCKTLNKFVVVELCDDIRIDTVQLANYEFFSGVFKDFSVSVAKTYSDSEGWTHAGMYRARNVRGVQSFRFPETLRDFYRYIRIDFHSHYGNEYFCPVSLLRVYGLTHLEEWKWDSWMAESRAKQAEVLKVVKPLAISTSVSNDTLESIADEGSQRPSTSVDQGRVTIDPILLGTLATLSDREKEMTASGIPPQPETPDDTPPSGQPSTLKSPNQAIDDPHDSDAVPIPRHSSDTPINPGSLHAVSTSVISSPSHTPTTATSSRPSSSMGPAVDPPRLSENPINPVSEIINNSTSKTASRPISSTIILSSGSATSLPPVAAPSHATTGGESVYRTIINKLTALETNYTLYTRYMDQQNGAIRELIKRLGEDIGRLDAATRAQRTNSQKLLNELEKQKMQMIVDYTQLVSRVEHLSEEILLEKRLGVIQLCLMLAVLVFMGLTRGSRGSTLVVNGRQTMREWGKRHLSLSGDWTSRFRRKSSTSRPTLRSRPLTANPQPSPSKIENVSDEQKIEFPKQEIVHSVKRPLEPIHLNATPTSTRIKKLSQTRSRTPSLRSTTSKRTPHTATGVPHAPTPTYSLPLHLKPQTLQRSSSQGAHLSASHSARSAKKWARTAHLHPVVKNPAPIHSGKLAQSVNRLNASGLIGFADIFSAPAGSFSFPRSPKGREPTAYPTLNQEDRENQGFETEREDPRSQSRWKPPSSGRRLVGEVKAEDSDGEGDGNWVDTDSVVDSDPDLDPSPFA